MTKIFTLGAVTTLAIALAGPALAKGHFQAGGGAAENGKGQGVGKVLAESLSKGGGGRTDGLEAGLTVKDGIDLERSADGVRGPGQSIAPGKNK